MIVTKRPAIGDARYAVKPKADRDLDVYADYLVEEASLDVALHFFAAAYSTFAILATQPNMGGARAPATISKNRPDLARYRSCMAAAATLPDLDAPVRDVARTDFVRLYESENVAQSLLRLRHERLGERIIYFYVTGSDGRLAGVVPTRRLLLADPSTPVRDVMLKNVVSVHEGTPLRDAMRTLTERRLLAVPVVDEQGALTGVFDISQYSQQAVDLERREEADRLFQLIGVHLDPKVQASVMGAFRRRFPWLLCNIGSGLIAAVISQVFDDVLSKLVALAFFVPVVLAIAESVAIQSLTLSLQQLDMPGDARPGAGRQLAVGALIGLGAGAIVGGVGLIWLRQTDLAIVLLGGLFIGATAGAMIGYAAPRLVHAWKLDPKIASGPASLALADMVALTAYLALATLVLR